MSRARRSRRSRSPARLQDGVVTPETTFHLGPTIQVADRMIGESHDAGYGTLSVCRHPRLLVERRRGDDRAQRSTTSSAAPSTATVSTPGSGASASASPTGVQFPGEEQGILVPPDSYSGSTMGNLPIGQGLSVTPMQMAAAYSAIADGGVLRTPQLVLSEDGNEVAEDPRRPGSSAKGTRPSCGRCSRASSPRAAPPPRCRSTATRLPARPAPPRRSIPRPGTYSDTQFVASFVGFAPADDPQLLVAVVVDNPKGDIYGGTVAAPAFGEIAKFALPYLGIPPDQG